MVIKYVRIPEWFEKGEIMQKMRLLTFSGVRGVDIAGNILIETKRLCLKVTYRMNFSSKSRGG